jgi:hypothetical protein
MEIGSNKYKISTRLKGESIMITLVAIWAFWIGILIGSLSASKLTKNQIEFENNKNRGNDMTSKPFVKENMYPYNWEDDEKFLAIIDQPEWEGR